MSRAEHDVFLAFLPAERHGGGGLAGDQPGEDPAVGRRHGEVGVTRLERPVRVEDRDRQRLRDSSRSSAAEVGPDLDAHVAQLDGTSRRPS